MQALWITYLLIVAVMAASLLLSYAIKNSKFGLGLLAIGQNEDAAAVLGVPTPRYKALVYSTSAFLPAVAGGSVLLQERHHRADRRLQPADLDRGDRDGDARRLGHGPRPGAGRLLVRRAARLSADRASRFRTSSSSSPARCCWSSSCSCRAA